MDPSFSQYEYLQDLDVVAIAGIDPQQLADDFVAGGEVDEAEGWVPGLNAGPLEDAQSLAQQRLETYIEENLDDPTVGEALGGVRILPLESGLLPSGLPYPKAVRGIDYAALPDSLRRHVRRAFATDAQGRPLDPVAFPYPAINNRRVTLSFVPATEADEQALLALLPEDGIDDLGQLPQSISAHLIRVVPQLKVEGQTVNQSESMALGEDLSFVTAVKLAGAYLSVNAVAGNVSPARLRAWLEQTRAILESEDETQIAALTREDLLGDLFHAGSLGYYAQYIALAHAAGIKTGGRHLLAEGYVTPIFHLSHPSYYRAT